MEKNQTFSGRTGPTGCLKTECPTDGAPKRWSLVFLTWQNPSKASKKDSTVGFPPARERAPTRGPEPTIPKGFDVGIRVHVISELVSSLASVQSGARTTSCGSVLGGGGGGAQGVFSKGKRDGAENLAKSDLFRHCRSEAGGESSYFQMAGKIRAIWRPLNLDMMSYNLSDLYLGPPSMYGQTSYQKQR